VRALALLSRAILRYAYIATFISLSISARAECKHIDGCDEIWVAAQDVGVPLSFFSKVSPARDVANIAIGDSLVSQHNLNVRSHPIVSPATRIGRLPEGREIEVLDIQRISIKGKGVQTWLRINAAEGAIQPPKAAGPDAANPSETEGSAAESFRLGEKNRRVVKCYKSQISGNQSTTIRRLFECSGYWVTPRALMACSMGAECPALPDTPSGKALLAAALSPDGKLSFDSLIDSGISLKAQDLPRLPQTVDLDKCNITSNATSGAYQTCVTAAMMAVQAQQIECFSKITDGEKLACFATKTGNKDYTGLVGCLAGGQPSPDKLTTCLTNHDAEQKVSQLRKCVSNASTGTAARDCLTSQLPSVEGNVSKCIASSSDNYTPCLDALSPDMKKARLIKSCVDKGSTQQSTAECIASSVGGDVGKLTGCLTGSDRSMLTVCVLGDSQQNRQIQRVYNCVSNLDAGSVLFSCADGIVADEKTRVTMACISKAGSDRAKLASCGAGLVLPKEAARIVGCATDSTGPTSFALCAAGPAMNEEWRIAAECAVESGGNPVAWGGCTAGRLTVRELTKCLNGKVGQDCFGPNNTIVVGLRNAYNDVLHGPGENNDIVKTLGSVRELTGGPNSVINNPSQIWGGPNSVFNNPGQILGGPGSVFHDPGQVLDPSRWRF